MPRVRCLLRATARPLARGFDPGTRASSAGFDPGPLARGFVLMGFFSRYSFDPPGDLHDPECRRCFAKANEEAAKTKASEGEASSSSTSVTVSVAVTVKKGDSGIEPG